MTISIGRVLWLGVAASGALGALTPASAQQATPQASQAATSGGLENIVVTAQKREENVQEVPIAIEAIPEHILEAMQITDLSSLGVFVPGLNVTRSNVASVPFIRGVGNFTGTPGNEAAIATYIDDVYYPSPAGSTFEYNNIESIDVLKGPQGTLFGRNAAGGVIDVVTKTPSATPHIDFSVGYANYNTVTTNFYGTTGITDNLVADLAASYENQADGWGTNLYNGKPTYLSRSWSGRTKWVFTPSDDWKFRFIADYSRTRNDKSVIYNIIPGTTTLLGYRTWPGFYNINSDAPSEGEERQGGISVRVDHDMGWASAASITSWRRSSGTGDQDGDYSPVTVGGGWYHFQPKQVTSTEELQLTAPTVSQIKWVGGVFLYSDEAALTPVEEELTSFASHPQSVQILDTRQNTTSYAEYGQATAPIAPDTRVTLGLRYTIDVRSIHAKYFDLNGVIYNQANGTSEYPKMTYRLALDHDFAPDVLGYISYNRGFKSGNYNISNATAAPVAPEVLDAYEMGVKSDLLDHTLRLNASAFYYQFHNLQVQEQVLGSGVMVNAGQVEFKGIDFDATAAVTHDLTLQLSAELLDATYTSFPAAVYNYPCVTTTIAAGCATSKNGGGYYTGGHNAAGNENTYSPPATVTFAGNYRVPTDFGDFLLSANIAYKDRYYYDVQNTLVEPSTILLGASATWTAPSGQWDVKIWGANLTGVEYFATEQVSAPGASYSAAPPRTYGVTAGYHWN